MDFASFVKKPPTEPVKYPSAILREIALPILHINDDVRKTAEIMMELMYRWKGVGLSAPQVGLAYRLFVMNPTGVPAAKDKEQVFINPEIIHISARTSTCVEGCLSIPSVLVNVERPHRILFKAQDIEGNTHKWGYEGLVGRVINHEINHLDGILIIDKGIMDENAKRAVVSLECVPVIEEVKRGYMTDGLKRLYNIPTRNYVDWSLFPYWARPDAIFDDASHEG